MLGYESIGTYVSEEIAASIFKVYILKNKEYGGDVIREGVK